jgi:RNA polymerase sigma-70 factor, ECF subfamily
MRQLGEISRAVDPHQRIDEWIEAARGGSVEAFGQLIETCRSYLLSVANRELSLELRAKLGASDLVQETACEAQQCFHQFSGLHRDEFLGWVRTILLNNLSNVRRAYQDTAKRQLSRELSLDDSNVGLKQGLPALQLAPDDETVVKEQARLVQAAIERLPEPFRNVIYLRHREHCSFAEIAGRCDRTVDAARKLWQRAVERLAEELDLSDDNR